MSSSLPLCENVSLNPNAVRASFVALEKVNACVENVDCYGNVDLLGISNRTDWNVTGSLSVKGLNRNVQEFQEFQGGTCDETGIGRYEDKEYTIMECLSKDDLLGAVTTNECPLIGGDM